MGHLADFIAREFGRANAQPNVLQFPQRSSPAADRHAISADYAPTWFDIRTGSYRTILWTRRQNGPLVSLSPSVQTVLYWGA